MNTFIGTKIINAVAMSRQAYNDFRGWQLPEDEAGDDDGYLTEVIGGQKTRLNTKGMCNGCQQHRLNLNIA
jgi:hypothetical protein